jgi:hypothetical protein
MPTESVYSQQSEYYDVQFWICQYEPSKNSICREYGDTQIYLLERLAIESDDLLCAKEPKLQMHIRYPQLELTFSPKVVHIIGSNTAKYKHKNLVLMANDSIIHTWVINAPITDGQATLDFSDYPILLNTKRILCKWSGCLSCDA